MKITTGIAYYDAHSPYQDKVLFKNILRVANDIKTQIFLLGGDNMNMSAFDHWLHDKGMKRPLEGRRIRAEYKQFIEEIYNPIMNNISSKCRKIWLDGNHECLDNKTELLTKRGWIRHNDIKGSDKVLSFSSDIEKLEWVKIKRITKYYIDDFLNRINTLVMDILATDDHKIFYKNRGNNTYKFLEISRLNGSRYQIPTSGILEKEEYDINDNIIKIIAWLLTDGYINKKYGYVFFSQRKSKAYLIENILWALNLKYSKKERQRNIKEICGVKLKKTPEVECVFGLNSESSKNVLQFINKNKSIPKWVDKLSKRQFDIFLSSLIDGDGSRHKSSPKTAWMLYGKKPFLDKIQVFCIQNGYSASISTYREKDYRLNICPRRFYNFENNNNIKKEKYNGTVWDLTVKNHNFLIRRNGKCHFTGNCWATKAIDKDPQGESYWEVENNIPLKKDNWETYKYGQHAKIGKFYAIHGEYTTKYHAAKTLDVYEKSTIAGHCHTSQSFTKVVPIGNEPHCCYSVPCGCNLNPEYRKDRPNAWVNGFAVFYLYGNGWFNFYPIIAINGHFVFNGKYY